MIKKKNIIIILLLLLLLVGAANASTYLSNYNAYRILTLHNNESSFLDDSTGKTVTVSSVTLNTSEKKFGAGSGSFSGTSALTLTDSTDWVLGSVWTSSAWVYLTRAPSSGSQYVWGQYQDGSHDYYEFIDTSGHINFYVYSTGYATNVIGTSNLSANTWYHIVVIQSSASTTKIYLNGVEETYSSTTSAAVPDFTGDFRVGERGGTTLLYGLVDELNLWKGVAIPISQLDPQTEEVGSVTLPVTITSNVTSGTVPLTIQFNDTSGWPSNGFLYANWSINNGTQVWSNKTSYATENISYTFPTVGSYNVSLYLTNNALSINQSSNITITAIAANPPVADFTYAPTSGNTPLAVSFTDTSTSNITVWNWTFGVANYSSLQNPSYTFIGAANYSVTLNVTNASGTNSITKYVSVSSVADPNPLSVIKYKYGESVVQINNQTPYVGTGTIRNISSNTTRVISNFTWNTAYVSVSNIRVNESVANITGLVIDSSEIHNGYAIVNMSKASGFTAPANAIFDFNITYVRYAAPGTYNAFSFDPSSEYYDPGNSTYWHFNTIIGANAIIGEWGPIVADLSANATTVAVGSNVAFSDLSTGYPDAWLWSFGDGSTSSLQNPTYAYSAIGNYSVTLTSYMSENATVTNTTTKTNYINVTAAPPPAPVAAFTASPTTVSLGTSVQFNDTSANTPTSWAWTFGDGGGSILQNPTHLYTSIGVYNVSLTATNAQGSSTLTKTNYINVTALAPPVAAFTSNVSSGGVPLPVAFTDTSSNTPTSWLWTFPDDSSTSTAQNPTHTFTTAGNWSVSLKATNAAGNNTTSHYINATTLSGFNRQDLVMSPLYTLTINFVDSSTNNPIPIVKVVNAADGTSVNTTTGTYTGTFGYTTVVLYCYSDGYTAKAVSYVMTGDKTETVQLTASTPTVATTATWYSPKTIAFSIVDVYGNRISGATMNAQYNSTTLPTGVSDLINNYGMNAIAANTALNGTLIMNGITDSMGAVVFTMMSTIKYDITVSYGGNTNTYSFYPQETTYQLKFIVPVATDNIWNDLYANGNTKVWATEPDIGNVTFCWSFQDITALTTRIDFYLKDADLNTTVYMTNITSPVAGSIYQLNYTVLNERGKNYIAWENYTRSV